MFDFQQLVDQILDYVKGIWVKKRYIIIVSWLVCPLGFIYIATLPDIYTSTARVTVDTNSNLAPFLRGIALTTQQTPEMQVLANRLKSRENLEKIARETDLDVTVIGPGAFDELIKNLGEEIQINASGKTNTFELKYSHKNPSVAKNVIQETLNLFIEGSLGKNQTESDNAAQFLQTQIDEYEQRLAQAEMRVADFKRKYSDILPETGTYFSRLKSLEDNLRTVQLTIKEKERQVESLQETIKTMQEEAKKSSNAPSNSIPTSYDDRISSLEQNLDELRLRFTELHPDVVESTQLLERLKALRKKEIDDYLASINNDSETNSRNPLAIDISQIKSELASLKVREDNYVKQINDLKAKIDFVPQLELERNALNRDYDIVKRNYQELVARQDAAELGKKASMSDEDMKFQVISPPSTPRVPTGPNRILLYTLVLLVGFLGGFGIAFLISQFAPILVRAEQLEKIAAYPILGRVTNLNWKKVKKQNRMRLLVFLGSSSVICLIYCGLVLLSLLNISLGSLI